jgi:hypothetical protein
MNYNVLWLEDEHYDLEEYLRPLYSHGYFIDTTSNVTDAIRLLRSKSYHAVVIDIMVHPGTTEEWMARDREYLDRGENSVSLLGLELLRSIWKKENYVPIPDPAITLDPKRVIILTGNSGDFVDEIASYGVPPHQIIQKATGDFAVLLRLCEGIES